MDSLSLSAPSRLQAGAAQLLQSREGSPGALAAVPLQPGFKQAFSFSEALHSGSEEEVMPQSSAVKRFFQDSWIQCRPGLWVTESAYPFPSNAVELHGSPGNSLHRASLEFPNTSDSERAWGSGSVRGPWPKALLTWEQNREAWRLVLPHPTGKQCWFQNKSRTPAPVLAQSIAWLSGLSSFMHLCPRLSVSQLKKPQVP
ncbi:hypothetical protein mRhiFer1_009432 [Rhinolophus ferrumequinum]|uniref:Uncharacterized protein n=1 Tax=Rhinolophus ferrumequinum TaxID=59479 RepID=A0A7J7RIW5_RHIFE|nr:hypothetical protein mRhiFer1_009432 [Rhinolophus ferrumequinum]